MNTGYYSINELIDLGFQKIGSNVLISRMTFLGGVSRIKIGSNVRIDDFTSISVPPGGSLTVGDFVHIGSNSYLGCGGGIELFSFSGLSQGVKIYSSSDDYSGNFLTNPMVPSQYRNVEKANVALGRHSILGSGTVVLPGCQIGEGVAVGALSLVNRSLDAWGIYFGAPVRFLKQRSKNILSLESKLLSETGIFDLD